MEIQCIGDGEGIKVSPQLIMDTETIRHKVETLHAYKWECRGLDKWVNPYDGNIYDLETAYIILKDYIFHLTPYN